LLAETKPVFLMDPHKLELHYSACSKLCSLPRAPNIKSRLQYGLETYKIWLLLCSLTSFPTILLLTHFCWSHWLAFLPWTWQIRFASRLLLPLPGRLFLQVITSLLVCITELIASSPMTKNTTSPNIYLLILSYFSLKQILLGSFLAFQNFHCREHGFYPCSRNWDPHMSNNVVPSPPPKQIISIINSIFYYLCICLFPPLEYEFHEGSYFVLLITVSPWKCLPQSEFLIKGRKWAWVFLFSAVCYRESIDFPLFHGCCFFWTENTKQDRYSFQFYWVIKKKSTCMEFVFIL